MPHAKYDAVLACRDYNVMGESCPFYSGGKCNILGWSSPDEAPEGGVCDKGHLGEGPVTKHTIILFDLPDDYEQELKRLYESDSYKRWKEAGQHYKLDPQARHEAEVGFLHQKASLRAMGGMTMRAFKKKFKPNGIGVTPRENPSFRMRVLDYLRPAPVLDIRPTAAELTERVALYADLVKEEFDEGHGNVGYSEYWIITVLTRNTQLQEEIDMAGVECWDGLGQLLAQHEGKKLLLDVHYYYSPGTYYDPNDIDFGIDDIQLVKVLDG